MSTNGCLGRPEDMSDAKSGRRRSRGCGRSGYKFGEPQGAQRRAAVPQEFHREEEEVHLGSRQRTQPGIMLYAPLVRKGRGGGYKVGMAIGMMYIQTDMFRKDSILAGDGT